MRWQQNSIYGKNIYGEIFYIFSISSILPSPDSGRAHKRSQNICCKANNMFELDDLIFLCYVVARERSLFVMRFDCDFNLGTIFLRIAFGCTLWRNAKLETKCFCMQMYERIYGETHTQSLTLRLIFHRLYNIFAIKYLSDSPLDLAHAIIPAFINNRRTKCTTTLTRQYHWIQICELLFSVQ